MPYTTADWAAFTVARVPKKGAAAFHLSSEAMKSLYAFRVMLKFLFLWLENIVASIFRDGDDRPTIPIVDVVSGSHVG